MRNVYMSITEDLIFQNNALRSEWLCIVKQDEAWTEKLRDPVTFAHA